MSDGEPATAEMHAAVAPAAKMAATSVTATSVATAAVTAASAAFCQRRTRQHGRDHQNCNSNEGLRHIICSGLIVLLNDAGRNQ
jgi:hypothetical protein